MKEFLAKLKAGWLKFFKPVAILMKWVWMILMYFLIIPLFWLFMRSDSLRLRLRPEDTTYWMNRKPFPTQLERHLHPF